MLVSNLVIQMTMGRRRAMRAALQQCMLVSLTGAIAGCAVAPANHNCHGFGRRDAAAGYR